MVFVLSVPLELIQLHMSVRQVVKLMKYFNQMNVFVHLDLVEEQMVIVKIVQQLLEDF